MLKQVTKSMQQKILLVEDDEFLTEIYVAKFQEAGFEISVAQDGHQGLRKAKEQKPNLLLLDLVMPAMDGLDVLRVLKNDPELQYTPVIVLSNLGEEEDVRKGIKLGAADYLIKAHYTPTEVVAKVKSILNL